jgi:hypothetical protein
MVIADSFNLGFSTATPSVGNTSASSLMLWEMVVGLLEASMTRTGMVVLTLFGHPMALISFIGRHWQFILLVGDKTHCPGRTERLMVVHLSSRKPLQGMAIEEWPDVLPWATPYSPGDVIPAEKSLATGNYTPTGLKCGYANVTLKPVDDRPEIGSVAVWYHNFSDDGIYFLDGSEAVTRTFPAGPWLNVLDWHSNFEQTGSTNGSKKTMPDGFHLEINVRTTSSMRQGT